MPEEPDDGWADEKWNAVGFLLKNFPVIAVVMGLVVGGLAASSFQGVGGSGYTPSVGGALPADGVAESYVPPPAVRAAAPSAALTTPPPVMPPEEFTAPSPAS